MRTPFLLPSVILQRMLIALCMCAAGTLVSRAAAQDNAAPLWRAAFQAAGYGTPAPIISTDEEAFLGNLHYPVTQEERAQLDVLLQRTAAVRQQFDAAARVRRADWDLDRTKGFALTLEHLPNTRSAARLMRVQVIAELDDSNSADALVSLAALGIMGAQSGQDRIAISSMVGSSLGSMLADTTNEAIDAGAVDQKAAQQLLEALGPLKGSDPFRYGDAIKGEWELLNNSVRGAKSDKDIQAMITAVDGGGKGSEITLENARSSAESLRTVYDRAALAFSSPDPNAAIDALRRLSQYAEGGRFGPLAKLVLPEFASIYQRKLSADQDLALLFARLQVIADGKEKREDVMNAALFLSRASAGARSVPDEVQESLELLRVAPAALDAARTERAMDILTRADRNVLKPLAEAISCKRCDFTALRHRAPTLDIMLLGGIRGATRMALADGLRRAREYKQPEAIVAAAVTAYRVGALLAMDPSLPRSALAHSIWRETSAAVQEAAKIGPISKTGIDEMERALVFMPTGDPFGFRKGMEDDAKDIVTAGMPRRDASANEAIAARVQILKQRGPGAVFARVAFASVLNGDQMPDQRDAALIRLTDLYSASAIEKITAAVTAAKTQHADSGGSALTDMNYEVPFDLPLDEQKARFKRADPVRGVQFIDVNALIALAGSDYSAAFDTVKAAGKQP